MSPSTVEKPKALGPGSGLGGNWLVIVRNDDHNTFEHVARSAGSLHPRDQLRAGHGLANKIHNAGKAIVWTGMREPAEHYWEQLAGAGLTMAPLEEA